VRAKPSIISQQCVVYNYNCDLCDAEYVSCTSQYLHQRIDEHRYSAIGRHLKNDQDLEIISDLTNNFSDLKKCNGKLDCVGKPKPFGRNQIPKLDPPPIISYHIISYQENHSKSKPLLANLSNATKSSLGWSHLAR